MNNEIASVRLELLSCDTRDLCIEGFLGHGSLNAIGLIHLTRWRPLCGFSGRDRGTLPQTHFPFRSSCKFFVRLKSYDWLELAMRSMVCECRLYVSCSARSKSRIVRWPALITR